MRFYLSLASLMLLSLSACTQQGEQSPPRQSETSQINYGVEKNPPQASIPPPSAAEVEVLIGMQDRIRQQPNEISLRRELGEKAIQEQARVVWTVGRAKLPGGAAAGAVAKSQAELAARIDAGRWAAYLLQWRGNDYATDFGSLQGRAPASEVAGVSYSDSSCVVLLKTPMP